MADDNDKDDLPKEFQSPQMRQMLDLLSKKEDLHPDLEPYLRQDGPVGPMLHHPLMINLFHSPQENARVNHAYQLKKAEVDKAAAEGNWFRYIFYHERPYRLTALLDAIHHGIDSNPKEYWEAVASVWTDSENIHECYEEWREVWTAPVPEERSVMQPEELAAFEAMPNIITVYRGIGHEDAAEGMSWTIDEEKAVWFAKRFAGHRGRGSFLVSGQVAKSDVLAYFTGRSESEIVALPENVEGQEIRAV